MKNNESGFSLVIIVIFMSIAALFVGYIMGSWLISFMTEESETKIAENDAEQVDQIQEVGINESDNNQLEINKESSQENILNEQTNETMVEQNAETPEEQTPEDPQFEGNDLSGTFAVQIGAFNNIDSAISLKEEMENLGFKAFITESEPHKIRVGSFAAREEAEEVEAQLEGRGYEGFIVFRD